MLQEVGTALEDQAVEFLAAVLWQELDLFIRGQGKANTVGRFTGRVFS